MVCNVVFTDAMGRPTNPIGAVSTEITVAEVLRRRILTGELAVGDRLRQSDLAAELGVSTTPVREALRVLVSEGLVEIDTNRGAVIRPLSRAELIEVLELQLVVESMMLERAIPDMNPQTLAAARAIHSRMIEVDDGAEWALLNRDFHLTLSAPSHRTRTLRMFRDLCNITTIQLREDITNWDGRKSAGEADHSAMLEAAAAGDVDRALALIKAHIGASVEHLREPQPV